MKIVNSHLFGADILPMFWEYCMNELKLQEWIVVQTNVPREGKIGRGLIGEREPVVNKR